MALLVLGELVCVKSTRCVVLPQQMLLRWLREAENSPSRHICVNSMNTFPQQQGGCRLLLPVGTKAEKSPLQKKYLCVNLGWIENHFFFLDWRNCFFSHAQMVSASILKCFWKIEAAFMNKYGGLDWFWFSTGFLLNFYRVCACLQKEKHILQFKLEELLTISTKESHDQWQI